MTQNEFFEVMINVLKRLGIALHIIVWFAYLSLSYSKFEWAENEAVQAHTKKLSGKQICCTTKWFL